MTQAIEFKPDPEDFIFTGWFENKQLHDFFIEHSKDLHDHDRCAKCGVWVLSQCTGLLNSVSTITVWQCPNCKATDNYY